MDPFQSSKTFLGTLNGSSIIFHAAYNQMYSDFIQKLLDGTPFF